MARKLREVQASEKETFIERELEKVIEQLLARGENELAGRLKSYLERELERRREAGL